MFIERLIKVLNKHQIPYALVGGYAVALQGAVRGTMDIDLVLRHTERDFTAAEKAFLELGLQPRLPVSAKDVFHFREEYIKNKNLVAWSFYNPKNPAEIVDVVITQDLNGIRVDAIRAGKVTIKVASSDDLIKMKQRSARPQDLEDIKALQKIAALRGAKK